MFKRNCFVSAVILMALAGCSTTSETADQANEIDQGKNFLMNDRPVAATTLGEAQEVVEDQPDVVIEGWADLKYFESKENEAIFMVREILEDSDHGGEGHDPSSCPFCKRRMEAAPKAAVVFVDDAKKVLPVSVDKLFELNHGDKVVISGKGKLDRNIDLFKITAAKIHIPNEH